MTAFQTTATYVASTIASHSSPVLKHWGFLLRAYKTFMATEASINQKDTSQMTTTTTATKTKKSAQ